jgi:hypothetical protein
LFFPFFYIISSFYFMTYYSERVSYYRFSKCAMCEQYHAENKSHIDEIRFVFGQHIELVHSLVEKQQKTIL